MRDKYKNSFDYKMQTTYNHPLNNRFLVDTSTGKIIYGWNEEAVNTNDIDWEVALEGNGTKNTYILTLKDLHDYGVDPNENSLWCDYDRSKLEDDDPDIIDEIVYAVKDVRKEKYEKLKKRMHRGTPIRDIRKKDDSIANIADDDLRNRVLASKLEQAYELYTKLQENPWARADMLDTCGEEVWKMYCELRNGTPITVMRRRYKTEPKKVKKTYKNE